MVRHGVARRGSARQGKARQGCWQFGRRSGKLGRLPACPGLLLRSEALSKTRRGGAWRGTAWQGVVRHGGAWQDCW
jgi:hypothetical protein